MSSAKSTRSKWTREQLNGFREWHEQRLKELVYPRAVEDELRSARESWLGTILIEKTK